MRLSRLVPLLFLPGVLPGPLALADGRPDLGAVPGVVIDHLPASSGQYVGSPALAVLPGGDYVAAHDLFGPRSTEFTRAVTRVFRSADRGRTWQKIAEVDGQFWSSLFVHRDRLYLLGTRSHYGPAVIRRSEDGGRTWTTPRDETTGLLLAGACHCAPVPVLEHGGRLWRAMEEIGPTRVWGLGFRSFVMSAPVDADLLRADSWRCSNRLAGDPAWLGGRFGGWLEGNAVADPDGGIVNVLRVDTPAGPEKAALARVSADGRTAAFDPATGFIDLPGGAKKFTIRRDPRGGLYWSLVTPALPRHQGRPGGIRNALALASSPDLRAWTVRCVVLYHPDVARHGYQYVDWQLDGEDLAAVCRTAHDDGLEGAHNNHDANLLTFHRIAGFRKRGPADSVPLPGGAEKGP